MVCPTPMPFALRENAADARGFRYSRNGQDISPGPHVGAIAFGGAVDFLEGRIHGPLQVLVHLDLGPEEAVQVLHPLEIRVSLAPRSRAPRRAFRARSVCRRY